MINTAHNHQKTINSILAHIDSAFLSNEALALPFNCWIRICTACNISCPLCPRQHIKPVDSGNMPLDEFRRLAEQMVGIERANLFGLGEPLLHKRFFEFAAICHDKGMLVSTTTNGMLLDESACHHIVESGIEEFSISMDSCTPELFNRLREGADFHQVCANVKRLSSLRAQTGRKQPFLFIPCTVSTENVHEFHKMVPFAHKLGLDSVFFLDFLAVNESLAHYAVRETEEFKRNLALARDEGARLGIRVDYLPQKTMPWLHEPIEHEGGPFGCREVWSEMCVGRTGDTELCCYLSGESCTNAFTHSFLEVVNSPERLQLRQDLIQGRVRNECRGCHNLVFNTYERVDGILNDAQHRIETLPIEEADRKRLRDILSQYRLKAREFFNRPEDPGRVQKPLTHRIGDRLRRLFRR